MVSGSAPGFLLMNGADTLHMQCDFIFASADAQFGFPEIKLGTIPGVGGTQRLTRTVGKQKVCTPSVSSISSCTGMHSVLMLTVQAMEMILTGAPVPANDMERLGVVNRVLLADQDVVEEALKVAQTIASYSAPAVGMAKQAVAAGK
jgi:enoyl-CoA hydratase